MAVQSPNLTKLFGKASVPPRKSSPNSSDEAPCAGVDWLSQCYFCLGTPKLRCRRGSPYLRRFAVAIPARKAKKRYDLAECIIIQVPMTPSSSRCRS